VSEHLSRRRFLIGACSAALLPMGCTSREDAETGGHKPHYVMVFDQNKCIGCGECKTACNQANGLPEGQSRLLLEQQSGRVEGKPCPHCGKLACDCERKFVRVSCQQCKAASTASVPAHTTRALSTLPPKWPITATSASKAACRRDCCLPVWRAAVTTRWCLATSMIRTLTSASFWR
jgi:protein NrfC